MHRLSLDLPSDTYGAVLPLPTRLRAVPRSSALQGSSYLVEGVVPAASVNASQQRLPSMTRGEGVLESAFDHCQLVRGAAPARMRPDGPHRPGRAERWRSGRGPGEQAAHDLGLVAEGPAGGDVTDRDPDTDLLPDPAGQSGDQQRVAAELEEVGVSSLVQYIDSDPDQVAEYHRIIDDVLADYDRLA